jgi:hypothetical protein
MLFRKYSKTVAFEPLGGSEDLSPMACFRSNADMLAETISKG